jgi:hypothetical protein
MKQVALGFAIAGAVVPIVVLVVAWLQGGVFRWPYLGLVFWPSWIMLMATSGREGSTASLAVLRVSIALNVLLYSGIGAVIWLLMKAVSTRG